MVRLWRLYQGGVGIGHLPESGGAAEQACIMLEAFGVMTAAELEMKPSAGGATSRGWQARPPTLCR
jgi:hypothetical protein